MGLFKNKSKSKYFKVTLKKLFKKYKYYLIGMDKYFNYSILEEITDPKVKVLRDKYIDYDRFDIMALDKNNNVAKVHFDNKFTQKNPVAREGIELVFLESYNNYITLSVRGGALYDKYFVYEIDNNKKQFVLMSEDFSITTPLLKEHHEYYVEAYYRYEDHYVMYNKSPITKCEFTKVEKKDFVLTVCIPAYNTEIFLPRTLDSIILNTFENFRMIVINDGSTDNTKDVLAWYANRYDFIEVRNDEWSGLSHVRNRCLDDVTTKYIAFSDSDDILSPNMYKQLYKYCEKTGAEVGVCKTIEKDNFNHHNVVIKVPTTTYRVYTYDEMCECRWKHSKFNMFFVSTVNKIVRTDVAKKVRFTENNHYEDTGYTPAMYTYVGKFVYVPDILYYWDKRLRQTTGSYSTTYNSIDSSLINRYYYEAISYPIFHGKQDNLEYISYSAIRELLAYYHKHTYFTIESKEEFRQNILDVLKRVDVEHNRFIQNTPKVKFDLECFTSTFTPPKVNILQDIMKEILNSKKD